MADSKLPSNATLDDLINFAKSAKKKKDTELPPSGLPSFSGGASQPGASSMAPAPPPRPPVPQFPPMADEPYPTSPYPASPYPAAPVSAQPQAPVPQAPVPQAPSAYAPPQYNSAPVVPQNSRGIVGVGHSATTLPDLDDLPDIDDDLLRPMEPGLDIDSILMAKKQKDAQSVQKLFTMDYLPPIPRTIEDTGLEHAFLAELVIKVVYFATELEGLRIAERLCLPFGGVIEPIVRELKDDNFLEIKGGGSSMAAQWRFSITHKGVEKAHEVLARNGYFGPAPVPIWHYTDMVGRQALAPDVSLKEVKAAFHDLVINGETLEKVGPAVNSAKSAFLYGPPGNGKTSICERICTLLGGAIFVPHALEIGGEVIKVYDPYVHEPPEALAHGDVGQPDFSQVDKRWVICKRPMVIVGGELTLEMLDLTYNPAAKFYEAPFQVKSNGGMLLIDDFGRQKVRPTDLLNRWIVPLEKGIDFLSLHTGKKCEIPFDQFIVFSTNLDPKDLVDEAFLRRLRYKIEIQDPSCEEYIEIFKRTCAGKGVKYSGDMMKYLLENYYLKEQVAFRSCHPRDLLDQIIDRAKYRKIKPTLTVELIDHAWKSYFVAL